MAFPLPKKTRPVDPEAQRFQESAHLGFAFLSAIPFLDGVLVEDVQITSGTAKIVEHGLGREPRGWLVLGKNANANVWETATSVGSENRMTVNASATVTISLWVF